MVFEKKVVDSTREAKFRPGSPAGPKIQARPVFLRNPGSGRWAHAGLGEAIAMYYVGCRALCGASQTLVGLVISSSAGLGSGLFFFRFVFVLRLNSTFCFVTDSAMTFNSALSQHWRLSTELVGSDRGKGYECLAIMKVMLNLPKSEKFCVKPLYYDTSVEII